MLAGKEAAIDQFVECAGKRDFKGGCFIPFSRQITHFSNHVDAFDIQLNDFHIKTSVFHMKTENLRGQNNFWAKESLPRPSLKES